MSDRLFRLSAVYEVNTVVCCIKRKIIKWTNLGITCIANKVTVKHEEYNYKTIKGGGGSP